MSIDILNAYYQQTNFIFRVLDLEATNRLPHKTYVLGVAAPTVGKCQVKLKNGVVHLLPDPRLNAARDDV